MGAAHESCAWLRRYVLHAGTGSDSSSGSCSGVICLSSSSAAIDICSSSTSTYIPARSTSNVNSPPGRFGTAPGTGHVHPRTGQPALPYRAARPVWRTPSQQLGPATDGPHASRRARPKTCWRRIPIFDANSAEPGGLRRAGPNVRVVSRCRAAGATKPQTARRASGADDGQRGRPPTAGTTPPRHQQHGPAAVGRRSETQGGARNHRSDMRGETAKQISQRTLK